MPKSIAASLIEGPKIPGGVMSAMALGEWIDLDRLWGGSAKALAACRLGDAEKKGDGIGKMPPPKGWRINQENSQGIQGSVKMAHRR
jgi:hypothetical protein